MKNVVSAEKQNDRFKELGSSVYMVAAPIGLAMDEVVRRSRRLSAVWLRWRKNPNGNVSNVLREIASVYAGVADLREAERKSKP